jgi:CRP/FNR family cyclic AMP-dependent transcriptional regulator
MISPEALRRYPYFSQLPEEALKQVAMICEDRSFKAGERLFEESAEMKSSARLYDKGQAAAELMILVSGEVDLVTEMSGGNESPVASLVAGDLMAESSMIEPYHLTVSGIAQRDGSMLVIDAAKLREMCEQQPALGFVVMSQVAKVLLGRLQDAQVQLAAAR